MAIEVQYRSMDGRFTTKLSSETEAGIVAQLVDFQNLLERNNICQNCKSEDVFWNIRKTKKGRYYEKKCNSCFCSLPYHSYKEEVKKGGLYYSYKDKWAKYIPPTDDDDETEESQPKRKTK